MVFSYLLPLRSPCERRLQFQSHTQAQRYHFGTSGSGIAQELNCCRAGLSNLGPTGRMRPARQLCAARELLLGIS